MRQGPAQPRPESAKPNKIGSLRPVPRVFMALWLSSHAFWLGLFHFSDSLRLPVAYGSYLLWAVSASFVWGRKGPVWSCICFLIITLMLPYFHLSGTEGFEAFGLTHSLLLAVMGLSSFSTSLWYESQKARKTQQNQIAALEQELIEVARSSSLGRMTVSISHEMKNQIAVTVGYLDQLRDEVDGLSIHKRKIDRSLLACDKMLKILDQLRTLARDTRLEPLQGVSLQTIIKDCTSFLERHFQYHGIELNISCSDSLPLVQADGVSLQTIFVNLLNLSIEGFKQSHQTVDQKKTIRISCQLQDQSVLVQYSDSLLNRPRIDSAEAFDLFFHVETKGLLEGLDLFAAQQLVHKIGGTIEFHQDPVDSLRVTLTLIPFGIRNSNAPSDINHLKVS